MYGSTFGTKTIVMINAKIHFKKDIKLKKNPIFLGGTCLEFFLAPNSTFPRTPKTHTHFMSPLPIFKFQWNSQMGDMVLEFPSRHTAFTLVNVRFACTRLRIPKEFSISCKVFDPTSDSRCQEVKKMLNLLDQHISSIKLDQKCFTNHMGLVSEAQNATIYLILQQIYPKSCFYTSPAVF